MKHLLDVLQILLLLGIVVILVDIRTGGSLSVPLYTARFGHCAGVPSHGLPMGHAGLSPEQQQRLLHCVDGLHDEWVLRHELGCGEPEE